MKTRTFSIFHVRETMKRRSEVSLPYSSFKPSTSFVEKLSTAAICLAVGVIVTCSCRQPDKTPQVLEPSAPSGIINGHGYVDLGLSVKWATCNVGATSPGGYGNYYAWGETTTKSDYTILNSKTYNNRSYSRDIGGDPELDAARANWGGTWRLPSREEVSELRDNCEWLWTEQNGHNGFLVTSRLNGNSIFLPAAGSCSGQLTNETERTYDIGEYWTCTCTRRQYGFAEQLQILKPELDERGLCGIYYPSRSNGCSVRPVSK